MINNDCYNCANRHTMNCPKSSECLDILDHPHYTPKGEQPMKPIEKPKKKQVHLRLKESNIVRLQSYANKRGLPMNLALDDLLEGLFNAKAK